ncbi:hypothetical protein PL321_05280 [Caloramator sp. mosi_1]|uniref:hypothetical protein n=1 Tax=Caloramator sp. mosi_1 TaxID=3023090 RepID=UPI00235F2C5E|nr:hypothetical protein [Caloramator sp. mosi_1]WDC84963.1 hypothetical protein PL321_05280 [Caloramator sp. mosi_1]
MDIKNAKITNIKMKDKNGGRIKIENTSVGELATEKNSDAIIEFNNNSKVDNLYVKSQKLKIKGKFDNLVEQLNFIERDDGVNLNEIVLEDGSNKTIKDIRNLVNTQEKMFEKLEMINEIYTPLNGVEDYNQWIENGKRFKVLLEDAGELGYLDLREFNNYDEVEKVIIANTIRAAKWGNFAGKFNGMDDIQKALNDALNGMYVERECRKLQGWGGNLIYEGEIPFTTIPQSVEVGADITEYVLKLKEGKSFSDDVIIKPINNADIPKDENEFVQVFKERVYLLKKTKDEIINNVPIDIQTSKGGSYTGINVKLENGLTLDGEAYVKRVDINTKDNSILDCNIMTVNAKAIEVEVYKLDDTLKLSEKVEEFKDINVVDNVAKLELKNLEVGTDYAIKIKVKDINDKNSEYIKRFTCKAKLMPKLYINDENKIVIDSSNAVYHHFSFLKTKRIPVTLKDENTQEEIILNDGKEVVLSKLFDPEGNEVVNRIEFGIGKDGSDRLTDIYIGINNPENSPEGIYKLQLRIVDRYGNVDDIFEPIYVEFIKQNSIFDFVEKFKYFSEDIKIAFDSLEDEDKNECISIFMNLSEEEQKKINLRKF